MTAQQVYDTANISMLDQWLREHCCACACSRAERTMLRTNFFID